MPQKSEGNDNIRAATDFKTPIIISLSGWFILIGYLYYNYLLHDKDFLTTLLDPNDYFHAMFHILAVVSPLLTSTIGYTINQRIVLHSKLQSIESHYRNLAAEDLRKLLDSLILAFANALDAKSPWTKGHSTRVAEYSVAIAGELRMTKDQIETIYTAALLHDIGKLGTYDKILDKVEPLSAEEYELIKLHPQKGVEILSPIEHFKDILPIIKHHHERVDGQGYPDGLTNTELPLMAKIVCLADSFDAMSSNRPYKKALGCVAAIAEIRSKAGTQFDPKLVDIFINILKGKLQ